MGPLTTVHSKSGSYLTLMRSASNIVLVPFNSLRTRIDPLYFDSALDLAIWCSLEPELHVIVWVISATRILMCAISKELPIHLQLRSLALARAA